VAQAITILAKEKAKQQEELATAMFSPLESVPTSIGTALSE
jgi:hypothetical protein